MRKGKIRGFPSRRSVSTVSQKVCYILAHPSKTKCLTGFSKEKKRIIMSLIRGQKSNNKHMVFIRG